MMSRVGGILGEKVDHHIVEMQGHQSESRELQDIVQVRELWIHLVST